MSASLPGAARLNASTRRNQLINGFELAHIWSTKPSFLVSAEPATGHRISGDDTFRFQRANRAHLRAAADRVPRCVRPLNGRAVAHRGLVYVLSVTGRVTYAPRQEVASRFGSVLSLD